MKTKLNYKGIEFDVEFDYQPAEKAERGPEAQYPGCPETAEITEILFMGVDFYEVMEDYFYEIADIILEQMHEY